METRKLTVSGLVQGVGFRWSTMALANKMNIPGTVKNNYIRDTYFIYYRN